MLTDVSNRAPRVEQLLSLPQSRVAVLLVDFQNDFCQPTPPSGAPTGSAKNVETALRANRFAADAAAQGVRVIYSQQILDTDQLTARQRRWETDGGLCVAGTKGAELFVEPVAGSRVVRKYRFDVWQSSEFRSALEDWDIDGLVIGGVELQCCVLYAVLGAEERGYHYVVPQDLVSGIDACEQTSNRAVRDYLGYAHPTLDSADELLNGWRQSAQRLVD